MRLSRGSPGHQPRDARPTSFATAAHWAGAAFETNRLLINEDFRVFTGFIERWEKQYRAMTAAKQIITEVVREWFEQQLIEVIYSVDFLRGDKELSEADIGAMVSDEVLTAAVLPRYHIEMAVRRTLGSKLGSVMERTS